MEANQKIPLSITQTISTGLCKLSRATRQPKSLHNVQSDLWIVLTDRKSVSIDLFTSKQNIFDSILPKIRIPECRALILLILLKPLGQALQSDRGDAPFIRHLL